MTIDPVVTPEMIEAGRKELLRFEDREDILEILPRVYRAMQAVSPTGDEVELVVGALAANLDISEELLIELQASGNLPATARAIVAALAMPKASGVQIAREALGPFASFAADNVGDEGWNEVGLSTKDERIVDWFGPSDFRRARNALTKLDGGR